MRILLLLSITCMGYAMENGAINHDGEDQPLFHFQQREENLCCRNARWCCDHHGGTLIVCGSLLCVGGFGGLACWAAGGAKAIKASSVIAQVMQ